MLDSSRRENSSRQIWRERDIVPRCEGSVNQVPYYPAPLLPPQRSTGVTLEVRWIRVPLRLWFCPQDWSQEHFPAVSCHCFKLEPSFENLKIRTFVCCILAVSYKNLAVRCFWFVEYIFSNWVKRAHRHKIRNGTATTHKATANKKISTRSKSLRKHLKPIKWNNK